MNVIKLRDLLNPQKNIDELNNNEVELRKIEDELKQNPALVNAIIQGYKGVTGTNLNEVALINPRLLRKLAAMLLGMGITASSLGAEDIGAKLRTAFASKQSEKGDAPTVKFVMPPAGQSYNKAASDGAGKQYEKPKTFSNIEEFVSKMADAIYKAEGGTKARSPYGVLSVKVKNKQDAERITKTSIRNNLNRWRASDKSKEFIDFMADRWCPSSADPKGNVNWKKNVKQMMPKISSEELTRLVNG